MLLIIIDNLLESKLTCKYLGIQSVIMLYVNPEELDERESHICDFVYYIRISLI